MLREVLIVVPCLPADIFSLVSVQMLKFLALGSVVALLFPTATLAAGSLADVNHVVLFMQENRAFDHVCFHGHGRRDS